MFDRVPADAMGVVMGFVPCRDRAALRRTCRAAAATKGSERVRVYVFTVGPPWLERLRRAACSEDAGRAIAALQPWRARVRTVFLRYACEPHLGRYGQYNMPLPDDAARELMAWLSAAFPCATELVLPLSRRLPGGVPASMAVSFVPWPGGRELHVGNSSPWYEHRVRTARHLSVHNAGWRVPALTDGRVWPELRSVKLHGHEPWPDYTGLLLWALAQPCVDTLHLEFAATQPPEAARWVADALRTTTRTLRVGFTGPCGPLLQTLLSTPNVQLWWIFMTRQKETPTDGGAAFYDTIAALDRHGHLRSAKLCVATSGAKRSGRPAAVYSAELWRNSPHLRSVMV